VLHKAWPLPALLSWAACWAVFIGALQIGAPAWLALGLGGALGAALALTASTPWRSVFIGLGFPLSLAACGFAGSLPAWAWLLPLLLLAFIYPLRAWRDAPLFPTPDDALAGLAKIVPLAPDARVVDAGCGLGAGLRELRREYPQARLDGLEWSWPLTLACAWRCRYARVRRADIWKADWSAYALVYLFQRPESMARAAEKALRELKPGAWMASLEFDAPGLAANKVLECADGRRVWLYQVPMRKRA